MQDDLEALAGKLTVGDPGMASHDWCCECDGCERVRARAGRVTLKKTREAYELLRAIQDAKGGR